MCTAITLKTSENHHLVGRNFDIHPMNDLSVALVPREFEYVNRVTNEEMKTKYAVLGMGLFYENHILFCDGVNEKGLSCLMLQLSKFSTWSHKIRKDKVNIAPYDVAFWVLSNFSTISELMEDFKQLNIVALPDDQTALSTEIHWLVSDTSGQSIVIERTRDKLTVYNNKVGVLANSPTFDWHLNNLDCYINVKSEQPEETKWGQQMLSPYSNGFGTIGLPGDFSSPSRFVKAAFLRNHVNVGEGDESAISECFHILDNFVVPRGVVETPKRKECHLTKYSACLCLETQLYYYKTSSNQQIQVIDLNKENLDAKGLKLFPYPTRLTVHDQN